MNYCELLCEFRAPHIQVQEREDFIHWPKLQPMRSVAKKMVRIEAKQQVKSLRQSESGSAAAPSKLISLAAAIVHD